VNKQSALVAGSEAHTMELTSIVTAAIISLAPNLSEETVGRYASDIVAASQGEGTDLALAMVATQDAESSWRPEVEDCRVTGDGGAAVSMWQLHKHWYSGRTRAEVCASNTLAASFAASALIALSHRTGGLRGALRSYIGCRPGDPRSVKRIRTFDRLLAAARLAEAS